MASSTTWATTFAICRRGSTAQVGVVSNLQKVFIRSEMKIVLYIYKIKKILILIIL